jgi:hypothetical protein
MTQSQDNARKGYARSLEGKASVGKNSWWYAQCPVHGNTEHLSYLGGRCYKCVDAAQVKKGGA